MTQHSIDGVQTKRTVVSEQLVECVALHASVVLHEQTAGVSLVAMVHVHISLLQLVAIVQTEVEVELQALECAKRFAV